MRPTPATASSRSSTRSTSSWCNDALVRRPSVSMNKRPVGHGRVQPEVVHQRHRRGCAQDAGAVVVRADVVAHHLALGGVAVDVLAEQRGRQEQRHDPQRQHHHELPDRHPLHLRERADQAVPDAHEQHEAAVHGHEPEEGEAVLRLRAHGGNTEEPRAGELQHEGRPLLDRTYGDGAHGDEPEDGGPHEQARPVSGDGAGLEVGTDERAEGPTPPHGLVPDRQAVEDRARRRGSPKDRSRARMRQTFPLDPSCRPSPRSHSHRRGVPRLLRLSRGAGKIRVGHIRNGIVMKAGRPGKCTGRAAGGPGREPRRRAAPRQGTSLRSRQQQAPTVSRREWAGKDSNLRRLCRQIYSLLPLAARAPTREARPYRDHRSAPGERPPRAATSRGGRGEPALSCRHAHVRRGLAGGHARGPQRRRPGQPRGQYPVRLQRDRLEHRARRGRAGPALFDRGPPARAAPGPRGEGRPPRGVAQGIRGRQGRGSHQGHGPPADRHQGGHLRPITPSGSTSS